MMNRPATMAGFTLWMALLLPFLVACGENEPAVSAVDSEATVVTHPPIVVREWYPHSKYRSRSTAQSGPSYQGRQNLMPQQSGSIDDRGSVPSPSVHAEISNANMREPVASPWAPTTKMQQSPGSGDYWTTRGEQYPQRPWGELTQPVKQDNRSQQSRQQGVFVPYGARQPGIYVYPGFPYGGLPYGDYPGIGYPGYIW